MRLSKASIGLIVVPCLTMLIGCADRSNEHARDRVETDAPLYFGQEAPGATPVLFAPGVISLPDVGEFASTFSADGREFYFGRGDGSTTGIYHSRLENERWSRPEPIITHDKYSYMDAMLSPDESRLYYISNQPLDGKGESKDPDLWFSNRTADGWGEPEHAGKPLNSDKGEYYVSFSNAGTIYFTSNREAPEGEELDFDIHSARLVDGRYQEPERLDGNVNSEGYDGDVFVSPDETYLIFSSERAGGFGSGDLYVSFRTKSGGWTKARNMGPTINTKHQDYCPFVTKDGRFLFFSSNREIYWVDSSVIDILRVE